MIQFLWPWLFLLLPLPLVWRWFSRGSDAQNMSAAIKIPFYEQIRDVEDIVGPAASIPMRNRWLVMWAVWILLVTAMARPMWLSSPLPVAAAARDLMLAIDLSGSMDRKDYSKDKDRLTIMKEVVTRFIQRRKGDKVGLIVFASRAMVLSPLTFDREAVINMVNEAEIGLAGYETAIGDAIGLAVKYMQNRDTRHKVLVLLTDGANNAGSMTPEHATMLAQQAGIKIYTIGIGAPPHRANLVASLDDDIDEVSLNNIAEQTGGLFFRASSTTELKKIYNEIDALEPIPAPVFLSMAEDRFYVPLVFALMLVLLVFVRQVGGLAAIKEAKMAKISRFAMLRKKSKRQKRAAQK
ncbi:MAG: VWA domain-containing protein [Alphaproteobacteria bacterium]|nr:VWA domain-containing protein [Alphaproteobacteria bacterium]